MIFPFALVSKLRLPTCRKAIMVINVAIYAAMSSFSPLAEAQAQVYIARSAGRTLQSMRLAQKSSSYLTRTLVDPKIIQRPVLPVEAIKIPVPLPRVPVAPVKADLSWLQRISKNAGHGKGPRSSYGNSHWSKQHQFAVQPKFYSQKSFNPSPDNPPSGVSGDGGPIWVLLSGLGLGLMTLLGLAPNEEDREKAMLDRQQDEDNLTSACSKAPLVDLPLEEEGQLLSLVSALQDIELTFTSQDKPSVKQESDLNFKVSLEDLRQGPTQLSIELLNAAEFKASALSSLDELSYGERKDDLVVVNKTASIIKGKSPSHFSKEYFADPSYLTTLFPGASISPHPEDKDKLYVAIDIKLGPIHLGTLAMDLAIKERKNQLPKGGQDKFLELDQELGRPHHVMTVEMGKANYLANGAVVVSKVYPVGKDSTLIVSYLLASINQSDIKVPLWFIRGPLVSSAKAEAVDVVQLFRKDDAKRPAQMKD